MKFLVKIRFVASDPLGEMDWFNSFGNYYTKLFWIIPNVKKLIKA